MITYTCKIGHFQVLGLVQNLSCTNEFDLHENEKVILKSMTLRLALL